MDLKEELLIIQRKNTETELMQLLPNEILFMIFDNCDMGTKVSFSLVDQLFNREYASLRSNIKAHYQILSEEMNTLNNKLDLVMIMYPAERYENKKWIVSMKIECPYHEFHILSMSYIKNPRDVDIKSWDIDGCFSYTML